MESTYISLIKFYIEKCSNQPLYSTSKVDTQTVKSVSVFCFLPPYILPKLITDQKKKTSFLLISRVKVLVFLEREKNNV